MGGRVAGRGRKTCRDPCPWSPRRAEIPVRPRCPPTSRPPPQRGTDRSVVPTARSCSIWQGLPHPGSPWNSSSSPTPTVTVFAYASAHPVPTPSRFRLCRTPHPRPGGSSPLDEAPETDVAVGLDDAFASEPSDVGAPVEVGDRCVVPCRRRARRRAPRWPPSRLGWR